MAPVPPVPHGNGSDDDNKSNKEFYGLLEKALPLVTFVAEQGADSTRPIEVLALVLVAYWVGRNSPGSKDG